MPVVVNELEVVVAAPEGADRPAPAPAAAPPPSPAEVAAILERRLALHLRTFAH